MIITGHGDEKGNWSDDQGKIYESTLFFHTSMIILNRYGHQILLYNCKSSLTLCQKFVEEVFHKYHNNIVVYGFPHNIKRGKQALTTENQPIKFTMENGQATQTIIAATQIIALMESIIKGRLQ